MKKLNDIALNEYDQGVLFELLEEIVNEEIESFAQTMKLNKVETESRSDLMDADFLRMNVPIDFKQHKYYKAAILFSELTNAMELWNE